MIISSCDAYVLVDTGATHACISEDFLSIYGLVPKSVKDSIMFVNTPLGGGEKLTRICRAVDVVIDDVHMPIDMLVLPISDFDVVLGMNWLNEYRATIDCPCMELSLEVGEKQLKHTLVN